MNLPEIKPPEKELLTHINRQGYECPIRLAIKFRRSQKSIQNSLDRLFYMGQIQRPMKGLVISQKWIDSNEHAVKRMEVALNISLPPAVETPN